MRWLVCKVHGTFNNTAIPICPLQTNYFKGLIGPCHSACMPWIVGLTAFTTVQRTKEIGIRRVLGANISSITFLIAKNFLQLIAIAIFIAIPLAWWAGNKWLQNFAFRTPVQVYVFILTALVTVLIALCTVGYHSIKVALTNPVKSLRSE